MRDNAQSQEAVSPVVGVMLMLVVTIIIAAVVSAFAGGVVGTNNKLPTATISGTYSQANGLTITHTGGDAVSLSSVNFMIFGLAFSLALGGLHGGVSSPNKTIPAGGSAVQGPTGGDAPATGTSDGAPAGGKSSVRIDYLGLVVAIIVEIAGLLALEKKPWRYIFPSFLAIMGIITLMLMATGNAKMGENGAAATVFPLGYVVTGILALCLAVILFMRVSQTRHVWSGKDDNVHPQLCDSSDPSGRDDDSLQPWLSVLSQKRPLWIG